ncbi:MAG TPA: molybdate ABC transporter substrate-binding protein [Thermoanaerobaculia bacterium]|jgi:molybdate transport system substrate-binding protein|nr:molybdate ABC transporter substrate-binding protein [Thermoanaerobaculia bacterium]
MILALAITIHVSAAASLTDVLQEIASHYGDKVVFNFGASSILARQIEEGAPIDVFISADEPKMDDLQRRGLIVKKSRRSILSNALVIVVPSDSKSKIASAKDLVGHSIAIAEPSSVPAGIYAKEYLRRERVWERVAGEIVPTENVRGALAAVESGNVDAGIVYKTDALISRAVKIAYEIPRAEGPKISYPAAVLADSNQKAAAQRFLDYLRSEPARAVFRRYGFLVP